MGLLQNKEKMEVVLYEIWLDKEKTTKKWFKIRNKYFLYLSIL